MALESPLGFGIMRLPVKGGDPTDFDYERINQMVDEFMAAGFTYFDTSYIYHAGKSEEATRKAVVERHARDSFTVATKYPTFHMSGEAEIEPIFAQQLENLGVDFVDYYLLHNLHTINYDGVDGNGGVVNTYHLFDHARRWVEEGKVRHLGISFHSSAALLDRILTEHPEVEFVQIAFNYIDCESELLQALDAYEVIRKHGKLAIFMQPVKGGGLSQMPPAVEAMLRARDPEATPASWAIRYAGSFDGVLCTLSGMSTIEQVRDNVRSVRQLNPLGDDDIAFLHEVTRAYRDAGEIGADLSRFAGLTYHGAPVTAILEAYNICRLMPDPTFCADHNYLKNTVAEGAHLDLFGPLPKERVVLADGTDETELVARAERWLAENSF
jgi:predicted aldo/keto reductase-like oxidoreductase